MKKTIKKLNELNRDVIDCLCEDLNNTFESSKPKFFKIENGLQKTLSDLKIDMSFYVINYMTDEGYYLINKEGLPKNAPEKGILGIYPKINSF